MFNCIVLFIIIIHFLLPSSSKYKNTTKGRTYILMKKGIFNYPNIGFYVKKCVQNIKHDLGERLNSKEINFQFHSRVREAIKHPTWTQSHFLVLTLHECLLQVPLLIRCPLLRRNEFGGTHFLEYKTEINLLFIS